MRVFAGLDLLVHAVATYLVWDVIASGLEDGFSGTKPSSNLDFNSAGQYTVILNISESSSPENLSAGERIETSAEEFISEHARTINSGDALNSNLGPNKQQAPSDDDILSHFTSVVHDEDRREAGFIPDDENTGSGEDDGDSDADYDDEYDYEDDYDDYDLIDNASLPVEQRLMNKLMYNYERSVRPVFNASEIVLVRMGLTLTQIFDMDEKDQVLVTNVWLDQEWDDTFLKWDPAEYDNLTTLRLPCHKIWLPDIVLYNNAAEYTDGLMPANAMITHEGNVFWPVPTKLLSTCKVDVTYFPFDDQSCRLKFGSWTYDGFQVDMTNRTTVVDLSNYVTNGEWELIDIYIERNVVYYACCDEPFPDVTFIIYIRRRTLYYLYNIIFPCVMMSALTLLVFCLPPDSGEKVTLGITVLLAFSVFLLRMGEDLPETSEFIPLLSIYLTIVMAMTSVSVIMTVFVLNLHHRGPDGAPVPKWLRKLLLRRTQSKELLFSKVDGSEASEEYYCYPHTRKSSLKFTVENLAKELKDELDHNRTFGDTCDSASTIGADQFTEIHEMSNQMPAFTQNTNSSAYTALVPQSEQSLSRTNTEILKALHRIIERYDREDSEAHVSHEWRRVALAVDRILFWIFLVGTLSSTIIVLVVAPLVRL